MSLQELSPELKKLLEALMEKEGAAPGGLHDYTKQGAPAPESAPSAAPVIGGKFGKLLSIIQGLRTGEGLPKSVQAGIGMASNMMYGEPGQDVSAQDIVNLQEGEQPNRGAGAIMGNIARIGARHRMAGRQLRQGDETRTVDLDLKRAQAERLRAWGPTQQRMLDLRGDLNDIRKQHEEVYKARSEAEAKQAINQLEVSKKNAEAAMISANARMKSATDDETRDIARLEFDREKQKYEQTQDAIKNSQAWVSIKTQQGWLDIGQQKAPGQMEQTAADTDLAAAKAEEQRRATGQATIEAPAETARKQAEALKEGIDAGILAPHVGEIATTDFPKTFEVTPRKPGWLTSTARDWNPIASKQEAAPKKPAPPKKPTPPKARPSATGRVTVVNAVGEEFTIPAGQVAAFLKSPKGKGFRRQ